MDDCPNHNHHPHRWGWADWKLVALLALLAAGVRLWQLTHTEVAARDSIGFIRLAWQFHEAPPEGWPEVLRDAEQHPLYPAWVLAVSRAVAPWHDGPTAALMQTSAQLASAIAAVLLVLPMYAFGRELFGRGVGFAGALLLQTMPMTGRILADGLSEATFLLFAVSALYFALRALRGPGGAWAFAMTGVFGALAYLTRPEGLLVVAAAGVVLLCGQAVRAWRRPVRDLLASGAALAVPTLALTLPYMLTIGHLTAKPSGRRITEVELPPRPVVAGGILLADWNNPYTKQPHERVAWGFVVLAKQLFKGSFYVGVPAALFGMWHYRRRYLEHPGPWVPVLVGLGVMVAVWRVAVVVGYLADRHTLLVQVGLIPWALAGLFVIGHRLGEWRPGLARLRWALPAAFAVAGLPKTLETLHGHRTGLREAGLWLAAHAEAADAITDPLSWSHYYAGRVFMEGKDYPTPPGHRPREYVVLEKAGNYHERIPAFAEAARKAEGGRLVFEWKGKRGRRPAEVHIYAVRP